MPAQPEALAYVASNPSVEVGEFPPPISQAEVVPPSPNVTLPLFPQLLAGLILSGFPAFPDALLEFVDRLGSYPNTTILVDPKSQQTALAAGSGSAFLTVDLQFQLALLLGE